MDLLVIDDAVFVKEAEIDEISGYKTLFISNADIKNGMVIEVTD